MNNKKAGLLLLAVCVCLMTAACAEPVYRVTEQEYMLIQKYMRLEQIISVIEDAYLFEYDPDALLEGAALGLLGALGDDYSYYYNVAAMEHEEEAVTGEYGGIGVEVFPNPNDMTITIRRVFFNTPAQHAGLRGGDKIIAIDGEAMTAYDLNLAVSMMRGIIGEMVRLTIYRQGEPEPFEVECERAVVQTEAITYEMLEEGIGYIQVHFFEGNATPQFQTAKEYLIASGVKGLVLDLRNNPGGFIGLAVDLADVFLDEALVAITEDKYGRRLESYTDEGSWDIPLAVLVNEYSASASEIVAAALRDNGVAKLVGARTYGKGIVQAVYPFADNTGMQLTTDYWLTPNGERVHGIGLAPDLEVELSEDAISEDFMPVREKDNQLSAAVALLWDELIP
ncbi:MAG: S41 family peptidase [Clostridia bacterium]|nr:S41 family peptidase [Clostridia bacterium]